MQRNYVVDNSIPFETVPDQPVRTRARVNFGTIPNSVGPAFIPDVARTAWSAETADIKSTRRGDVNRDDREDTTIYRVVINDEEQYSIWPTGRSNPLGWRDAEKSGSKAECLAYIEEVWTDMRPLSLRKHMDEAAAPSRGQTLS
jgi:MbtH protein